LLPLIIAFFHLILLHPAGVTFLYFRSHASLASGGSGVWIGQKESRKSLNKIVEKLWSEPERYIVQQFEHLSVLDDRIVDLRIHAHVDSEQIIVSNTPWGRANWLRSNGKVNIGSDGFCSPVVVVRSS
jgi:uncharacterized circularly permuted ATP-grasp superfamily protein